MGTHAARAPGCSRRLLRRSRAFGWNEVVQHVPFELAERARAAVTSSGADAVVMIGGGSSTGLAKAIALTHGLPI
ncbi:MAG: iron-containing alcohol dehydrogenase, partial [Verrucomicrobia bacterium]|nr:iron-containing alcohol dehydrogenase [Verrucomicrobiota bacterium]